MLLALHLPLFMMAYFATLRSRISNHTRKRTHTTGVALSIDSWFPLLSFTFQQKHAEEYPNCYSDAWEYHVNVPTDSFAIPPNSKKEKKKKKAFVFAFCFAHHTLFKPSPQVTRDVKHVLKANQIDCRRSGGCAHSWVLCWRKGEIGTKYNFAIPSSISWATIQPTPKNLRISHKVPGCTQSLVLRLEISVECESHQETVNTPHSALLVSLFQAPREKSRSFLPQPWQLSATVTVIDFLVALLVALIFRPHNDFPVSFIQSRLRATIRAESPLRWPQDPTAPSCR